MCAMKFPQARLPDSFLEFVNFIVVGTGSGLSIVKNTYNKTVSFAVDYNTKNLKMDGNGKLNTVIDLDSINTLKITTPVTLNKGDVIYKDTFPNYIGFSFNNYNENEEATVLQSGEIILTDTLIPNSYYYVSNADNKKITDVIPTTGWFIRVGIAKDEHTLIIEQPLKIKL